MHAAAAYLHCRLDSAQKFVKDFLRDEDGGVLGYVLVVGVISIPLVIFLAIFGQNVVTWVQDNAPNIFNEADNWAN
ncbi:MAG: hypothetical protein ACU0BB_04645 [Paracoccaceae bacterium]